MKEFLCPGFLRRGNPVLIVILMGVGFIVPSVLTATPTNRYVSAAAGVGVVPYDTWAKAGNSIKTVVDYANTFNEGDLVIVSNGAYTLTATINVTNTIVSNFSANVADTTINGAATYRCFYLNHPNAMVYGLTISNGYASGTGAGGAGVWIGANGGTLRQCTVINNLVFVSGNAPTVAGGGGVFIENNGVVTGCVIRANRVSSNGTSNGGGGACVQYNGVFTDCDISGNVATNNTYTMGGGLLMWTTGCSVVRCTIAGNTGQQGAGISIKGDGLVQDCTISNNLTFYCNIDPLYANGGGIQISSTGTITRCTIVNNNANAGYAGGGIYVVKSGTIERCTIANNSANSTWGGGGVFFANGAPWSSSYADALVRNCLIVNNEGLSGGGIYVKTGSGSVVENCTIVSNRATIAGNGGGGAYYIANSTGLVVNSIVYFNRDNGTKSNWYNAGIVSFTNSCTAPTNGLPGTNNITDDPKFVGKDTGNYRLLKDSRCINAGTNRPWMDTAVDLFGHVRIVDGTVDMGAYEWYPQGTILQFR